MYCQDCYPSAEVCCANQSCSTPTQLIERTISWQIESWEYWKWDLTHYFWWQRQIENFLFFLLLFNSKIISFTPYLTLEKWPCLSSSCCSIAKSYLSPLSDPRKVTHSLCLLYVQLKCCLRSFKFCCLYSICLYFVNFLRAQLFSPIYFFSSILLISKIENIAKSHKMSNYEFFEILIAMIDF